jgi:uncharacterized OsmC-like protein
VRQVFFEKENILPMKVNLPAIEKFAAEVQQYPTKGTKEKSVAGECNFADGPHFSATVEFAQGKATLTADNPPFMGGEGSAPDPVNYCLFGTAACFAGTLMTLIAQRGLDVNKLTVSAHNRISFHRALGLGKQPPVDEVWLKVEYSGAATQAEMHDALNESLEICPGAYCINHAIPLSAEIRKN